MSDLHGRLAELGAESAHAMSQGLGSEDRIDVLAGRIAAGRRRRGAAGAAGVLAGVTALLVGLWAALPGAAKATWDPASPEAATFDVRLDDYADAPVVPAQVDTVSTVDAALLCGQELSLDAGVTIHDASAVTRGARIVETLGPLVSDEADTDDSDDRMVWSGTWGGREVSWSLTSLLVVDDVIVGVSAGGQNESSSSDYVSGNGRNYVPAGGECSQGPLYSATETVGTPILVAQAYVDPFMTAGGDALAELDDSELSALWEDTLILATVVIDPREPVAASETMAALVAPSEGVFEAFSAVAPAPACNALGDLRDGGAPVKAEAATFVSLGDQVASIRRVLDSQEPFATVPRDSWMAGADAWVVADSADGAQMARLEWHTDGDGREVAEIGDQSADPLRPDGCQLPESYDASGAAFLVVDAVAPDLASYGATWDLATADTQTWIYLGDA